MLKEKDIIVAPGCNDPLSAKIIESLGFDGVYLGGWIIGAQYGITEPGTTLTEMVMFSKYITDLVNCPLIVDAGACFGDAVMARRTVKEFEKAGVSAIHIEDQVVPKRVSYHKGEYNLIPVDEMLRKIDVCCKSRQNEDFVIIARTDAGRAKGESFDNAIKRANIYAETDVDLVAVFPRTIEEIKRAPKEIKKDLMFVAAEGLGRPIPTIEEIKSYGYKVVIYGLSAILAKYNAIKEVYTNLKENGHTGFTPEIASKASKEIMNLIALPNLQNIEDKFYKK